MGINVSSELHQLSAYITRLFHLQITEGRKEMLYLTTHSTHFIYCYMALDMW